MGAVPCRAASALAEALGDWARPSTVASAAQLLPGAQRLAQNQITGKHNQDEQDQEHQDQQRYQEALLPAPLETGQSTRKAPKLAADPASDLSPRCRCSVGDERVPRREAIR